MVAVAAGTLELGSAATQGASDEHPESKAAVVAFCLDAHEVTVAEYRACEKNKACTALARDAEAADRSKLCSARLNDNDDLPATCVNHAEATRYCAWKGYRLPTEIEWEWAATGGEDKLPWSWGDSSPGDDKLCFQRPRGPCRVKSKAAGAFELFDMLGGVAEWTSTAYGPYGGSAPNADRKVVRGGSWESAKDDDVRPKKRSSRSSSSRDPSVGFRCAANR
jgi:formylglycine-generating enzyme required for sulfatase activity